MCASDHKHSVARAFGDLREGLLELAWPTRCIGCDAPGQLLCPQCAQLLPFIDPETACPLCGAPYGVYACTECWTGDGKLEWVFSGAACAFEFTGLAPRLCVAYKDQGERRLSALIARYIAEAAIVRWSEPPQLVTYVPATKAAVRRRGFDHMGPVAQMVAQALGASRAALLRKADTQDQRVLDRMQRIENMRGAFDVIDGAGLATRSCDGPLLLIDDVFTTGATIQGAAAALRGAGFDDVRVATLCRVW